MVSLLRKYKLEKRLFQKTETFLVVQILPVKEHFYIEWVLKLAKYSIDVKFLKTKQGYGILTSFFNQKRPFKKLFTGSVIYLSLKPNFEGSLFMQLHLFLKETSSLFINKNKRWQSLGAYEKGQFYHIRSLSQDHFLTNTFEPDFDFIGHFKKPVKIKLILVKEPMLFLMQIMFLYQNKI